MDLLPLIYLDEELCLNCHQCISVCPAKFANDGSGDTVTINENMCIGCGQCIEACTHDARIPIDDTEKALEILKNKQERMIAVVAPAVASNFPENYLRLNGWLKHIGVEDFFDVSFGAELTVKSYIEHIRTNKPEAVIAQPCPAIVTYIQTYKPELIPYLAPADSPMVHTIKMIKEFYPQYKDHKILVVSPCIAKKREFEETQMGDYNCTISTITKHLSDNEINLSDYPPMDYSGNSAERAVLFSTPGGLLETAEREIPGIRVKTRKIEGVQTIYHYLENLEYSIKKGINPLIIDCLNCELGCNGGTGTQNQKASQDELEHFINQRKAQFIKKYSKQPAESKNSEADLRVIIDKYWVQGLYKRDYLNHSENFKEAVKRPTKEKFDELYHAMHKYTDDDIKNCASCGYNLCEEMATAIHNGYNKIENCHFFLDYEMKEHNKMLNQKVKAKTDEIVNNTEELLNMLARIKRVIK